jgi:cytochrome P450
MPRRSSRRPRFRDALRTFASQDPPSVEVTFPDPDVDLVRWRMFGHHYVVTRLPRHVEHVFIGGYDRYRKSVHYRLLAAVTGEGLLTNEGEPWARQRRLMQPVFHKRHLDRLVPHMTAATGDFLDRWQPARSKGAGVDMSAAMTEVTLDVVGRALFGATLVDAVDRLRPAVAVGLDTALVAARLQMLVPVPRSVVDAVAKVVDRAPVLPPPLGRVRRSMHTIDGVVRSIIDERVRTGTGDEDDLLALLLAARDEDGRSMDRQQVRDELVTLMLAGHETTANGLAWLWYLLDRTPACRERLYDEVDRVLGGRVPTADDIEHLPWTMACFQESLRLYPPAWVLERDACVADDLDGEPIPRGTTVIFPVHIIHRDPRWWPDAETFDPTRFLPGAPTPPRGAYLPFGAGRRSCIGSTFALVEGTIVAAMIAQRYELGLDPAATVVPSATVTLRPRGLTMVATERPRRPETVTEPVA